MYNGWESDQWFLLGGEREEVRSSAGVPPLSGTMVHVWCWLDVWLINPDHPTGPQLRVWVTHWFLQQCGVLLVMCWCFAGNLSRSSFWAVAACPCSGLYNKRGLPAARWRVCIRLRRHSEHSLLLPLLCRGEIGNRSAEVWKGLAYTFPLVF